MTNTKKKKRKEKRKKMKVKKKKRLGVVHLATSACLRCCAL